MRSNGEAFLSRVAILACGAMLFFSACGGGGGKGGQGGAKTDGGDARTDSGGGGQGGRTDGGAGGASTDAGAGGRGTGGAATDAGVGGQNGDASDSGDRHCNLEPRAELDQNRSGCRGARKSGRVPIEANENRDCRRCADNRERKREAK